MEANHDSSWSQTCSIRINNWTVALTAELLHIKNKIHLGYVNDWVLRSLDSRISSQCYVHTFSFHKCEVVFCHLVKKEVFNTMTVGSDSQLHVLRAHTPKLQQGGDLKRLGPSLFSTAKRKKMSGFTFACVPWR